MQPINFWHGVILVISLLSVSFSSANEIKPIPSLNKILKNTRSYSVGKNTSFHEIEYANNENLDVWYKFEILFIIKLFLYSFYHPFFQYNSSNCKYSSNK